MKLRTIFILLAFLLLSACTTKPIGKKNGFKKSLPGKIVFVHRDGDILTIYKINANGSGRVKLFSNTDPANSNSLYPRWSEDGSQIRFTAMKDGGWRTWVIDADGANPRQTEEPANLGLQFSRAPDIEVRNGSIFTKGTQAEIYKHRLYEPKFNMGAIEVSWGPQKKYIVFECSGAIYVAKYDGSAIVKITDGGAPEWWYEDK